MALKHGTLHPTPSTKKIRLRRWSAIGLNELRPKKLEVGSPLSLGPLGSPRAQMRRPGEWHSSGAEHV
eukprot:3584689-Pyramimonas_sp.AAC.1